MNFLKKTFFSKTFWVMTFITILGVFLRLISLDKPQGLWNDEYISWSIASIPFGKHFFDAIFAQCHMPFYYLFLKFFIHFFGNGDLMLRFTSFLTGVLSIWAMYYVGKEFKNKNLGVLCAAIASISSFLIYFSQEVRFYEILFLFSALSLLFTLKLGKTQNWTNLILYALSNFLVVFTHTIGFVFVVFNLIFISLWLGKTQKFKKPVIIGWAVICAIFLPFVPFIFKTFACSSYSYAQWWGHFTVSKLGFLVTDYFSPMLTNIVNAPDSFFYNFTIGFILFALLPSIIALVGIYKAIATKKYQVLGLFFVSLATLLVLVLASMSGKLVFITKYSIEIYPTLILLMGFGLLELKNIFSRRFLIFLFCFISVFYLLTNPFSAPKMPRNEGHALVAQLLKNANLNKGDFIILNYYPQDKFEKYFNFSGYNVVSINKYFDKKLKLEIVNKLKHNQKVTVIILNSVAIYSPVQMQSLVMDENEYKKAPFLFLVFSHLKNEEMQEFLKDLQISRFEQKGSWAAITFTKSGASK